jgi:hypothetical protein
MIATIVIVVVGHVPHVIPVHIVAGAHEAYDSTPLQAIALRTPCSELLLQPAMKIY